MFIFKIVPRYAYDIRPLSVPRQAINRINDGLMLLEAWSIRFMALNNSRLIFTKKMHLKLSSAQYGHFGIDISVLEQ